MSKTMGLFGKKKDAAEKSESSTSPELASDLDRSPQSDPNLIKVFDEFGRELFIDKEKWRKNVLPGTLRSNWNNPEQLYNIIAGSLKDGFFADVLGAAEHLYRIDPIPARVACLYGVVLMKNNRLGEAERVFQSQIEKHGEEGYVLTNLAKVYSARNETRLAEETLWHALEVDPNQENGLMWYTAIQRERSGEEASQEALRRVASLPNSWRAQLWLARAALETRDLGKALTYYRQSFSRIGEQIPADVLMQVSGDLGRKGHLSELLELTESRFVPELHGVQVGNNLIRAHLDLGQIEAAKRVLDQLYALKRPDYKQILGFWDTEIAKAQIARTAPSEAPMNVAMSSIEGPVWLKSSPPDTGLFPPKASDAPAISFLGSSAEVPSKAEQVEFQISDAPGRMSRALPLFLAEQVGFHSTARVQTLAPWITGKSSGFVLSAVRWRDEDAAKYALQGPIRSDFVVVTHIEAAAEPWTVELRVIRSSDHKNLGELRASFQSGRPEDGVLSVARQLLSLVRGLPGIEDQRPAVYYDVPAGVNFAAYLLRLEQLLAVRCAGMQGVQPPFLSGEREILDGNLQLCVACPNNVGIRVLLANTARAMKRVRPSLVGEFKEKLRLLQEKKPLPEPAHSILEEMFSEALSD